MEPYNPQNLPSGNNSDRRPIGWERELLEKLAMESLLEQRRKRRWGIFFKLIAAVYIGVILFSSPDLNTAMHSTSGSGHTAVVDLQGVIDAEGSASAERINGSLKAAFEDAKTVGVILRINSPGGSPVQSGLIYDEILRLRQLHPKTPLYAVIGDICASGGYYVAAAADRIYVDKASLVGSIGVLMDGFGFEQAMKKVGVERRMLTAGENKGFLDPFSPMTETQTLHAKAMLKEIHQQFIDAVKKGRGERLKDTEAGIFSGLVWNGTKSIELGLSDELGSAEYVAREVLKAEDMLDFTQRESITERLVKRAGVSFGEGMGAVLNGSFRLR
jgi:protease-4